MLETMYTSDCNAMAIQALVWGVVFGAMVMAGIMGGKGGRS